MKRSLFILSFLSVALFSANGQDRVVSGTVTAEDGSTIPGVNVLIKGTTTGTIADVDGNYKINASQNDVLVFSFVGFETQEMPVGASSVVDVQLIQSSQQLSEVIVVGYGSQRKEQLTGSVQTVGSNLIEKVPAASFQEALQGNSPGLQVVAADGAPGGAINIRVRGIGSINASNEPLYVIDGIPVQDDNNTLSPTDFDNGGRSGNVLSSLNPNDIESLVVLKDAASTAIYGSRGANGVILITTKSGSRGQSKVDLNTSWGFSDFAFDNLLEPLNEAQYRQLYIEGHLNAGNFATEQEAIDNYNAQFPQLGDTDWLEEMTQTGVTQKYNVSVSGGNEALTYFASVGTHLQEGTVVNSRFERYNSRLNIKSDVNDWLSISNNLALTFFQQRGITDGTRWQAPFYLAYLMAPSVPVFDDQGRYYGDHASFFMGGNNPVGHLNEDKREREQSRIIENFSATVKLMKGLSFTSAWSIDLIQIDDYLFANGRYGDGRNVGGSAEEATTDQVNWVGTQTLNYGTTLAGNHNMEVLLGYEAQKISTDQVAVAREGFAHPRLKTPSVGANPQAETFTSRTGYAFNSVFGRVNYDYLGKYYLSFSLRGDGSSRFGPDERWGTFWSIGGGYNISDEGFLQGVSFIDFLKIRASFGVTGNADIGNFDWAGLYGFNREYDGNPGSAPSQISNNVLTWESQENLNIGVDLKALRNRLNVTADWFQRTSSDLLLDRPVSLTTGFEDVTVNFGDMQNKGVELGISGDIIDLTDFKLTAGFNITFLTNEITSLPEAIVDGTKRREEGRDFQEFWLYGWAGVNPTDGSPLFFTDETKSETTTDVGDAVRFYDGKSATPDHYGSFNVSASYLGLTLSTQWNWQAGNYVYDAPGWVIHGDGRFTPRSTTTWAFENRWTTPGQEALFPRHSWGNRTNSNQRDSDRYLFAGDFLRMRTVSLSYDIPAGLLTSTRIVRTAQLYILMNNYLTLVKDDQLHFDPEQTINGVYNTVTPIPKTITFGVKVGF